MPAHAGIRRFVTDLNHCYAAEPALHRGDGSVAGFAWLEANDVDQSVFAYLRLDPSGEARPVVAVVNATPMARTNYRLGVPHTGRWAELLNSDADVYGGSGVGNLGGVESVPIDSHGYHHSILVTLPPLGASAAGARLISACACAEAGGARDAVAGPPPDDNDPTHGTTASFRRPSSLLLARLLA